MNFLLGGITGFVVTLVLEFIALWYFVFKINVMDYEKKYKEAFELMKDCIPDEDGLVHVRPCDIFPELAESKDEKIKRVIMNVITKVNYSELDGLIPDTIRIWLEKQGEQREIDYDEELKRCKANPLYFFDKYVKVKLKEQKPAEWSEEDKKMLDTVIEDIVKLAGPYVCYRTDVEWLKSLKGRYTWKPSEEQMEALYNQSVCAKSTETGRLLCELYNDLKKLREE